jgi:kumamolisin
MAKSKRGRTVRGGKRAGGSQARSSQRKSARSTARAIVPGSNRPIVANATRIGDVPANAEMTVTLALRGPSLPTADRLPAQTLSPEEFARTYGASASDADQVTETLKRFGLNVSNVSLPTRSLQVSGSAAQMTAAFGPQLGLYRDAKGSEFRDRHGTYGVPRELAGIVTAVLGFGQRQVARRRNAQVARGPALDPLTPADIESLYAFPADPGSGPTVGIAEFGGGYFDQDLAAYCAKFNRRVPAVQAISVNRPAYTLQQILQLPARKRRQELGDSIEVNMDVQVIAGLCPSSNINVYFATFDQKGWVDLLNRAITDRPVALSVSWGLPEDDPAWSKAARDAITERLTAAALLGITVCVAAGDDGSGDEETDKRAHVDFPGSSPFVLCVGGTMIMSPPLEQSAEQVWWESPGTRAGGGGSTGGGVSVLFPRPKWQTVKVASLNKNSIDGRIVPDVAAVAGPPFYDLIFVGKDSPNGGTSASAPVWSALLARVNAVLPLAKRQRFLTPLLYAKNPQGSSVGSVVCRDIKTGNNASMPSPGVGYKAKHGFDAASGWGTPRGAALVSALS